MRHDTHAVDCIWAARFALAVAPNSGRRYGLQHFWSTSRKSFQVNVAVLYGLERERKNTMGCPGIPYNRSTNKVVRRSSNRLVRA